jgi:succinyl-CoA synthetase alpha subunit
MSILITPHTKILIQGITGDFGGRHAKLSLDYGTQVVAGVTPGKGGQFFEHGAQGADLQLRRRRRQGRHRRHRRRRLCAAAVRGDAILEGVDAGLDLVVAITEGIPIKDMIRVKRAMHRQENPPHRPQLPRPRHARRRRRLQGRLPHRHRPGYIHKKGHVGVVSRSGTLTYEAVYQLTSKGIGQSTCVGIGGDPVNGTSHLDVIKMFNDDPDTHGIIMIGEIGGNAEVEAARWIKANCKKPVAGFIAGATAPAGRRMGHAGAIVGGAEDTAAAKIAVFKECGIEVAATPSDMADALLRAAKATASWQSLRIRRDTFFWPYVFPPSPNSATFSHFPHSASWTKLSEIFSGLGRADSHSRRRIRKGSSGNRRFCQPGLGVITVVSSGASHPDVRPVKRPNKKLLLKKRKSRLMPSGGFSFSRKNPDARTINPNNR